MALFEIGSSLEQLYGDDLWFGWIEFLVHIGEVPEQLWPSDEVFLESLDLGPSQSHSVGIDGDRPDGTVGKGKGQLRRIDPSVQFVSRREQRWGPNGK